MRPDPYDQPPVHVEAVSVACVALAAGAIVIAYAIDLLGGALVVWTTGPLAIVLAAAAAAGVARHARADREAALAWLGVTAVSLTWLLWMAWPTLLPLGGGPDLVHHLSLIRYLETERHLPHDLRLEDWLGEMVHYTPGSHILVVLAARLAGVEGLRAVHVVAALAVALKAGVVALLAMRLRPASGAWRAVTGVLAVALLFVPRDYTLGAFTHDSYLAQVVSETFVITMLWAMTAWDARPGAAPAAVAGLCGAAAFLTWPVFLGPPLLAAAILIVARPRLELRARLVAAALALLPAVVVAAIYVVGRLSWVSILKTSGAVVSPSLASLGWIVPGLATAGLVTIGARRQARATIVMLAAIAAQAAALFVVARAAGADTPYMAYKMIYLAVSPAAALAAAGATTVLESIVRYGVARLQPGPIRAALATGLVGWILAGAVGAAVVGREARRPPSRPPIALDLQQAARWLKGRGITTCVDFVTPQWVSAYWLQVVELGHPRMSPRTAEIADEFDPKLVVGRWVDPRGAFQYAIVDQFDRLHPDARVNMVPLARFGEAAVVRRRETVPCR